MKRLSLVAICLVLLGSTGVHAQDKKLEVRTESELVYGKAGDADLKLDLAMPKEGDGPFPAIVCVHGGGWRGGSRNDLLKTTEAIAARGYVAVTIAYRLVPTGSFPAQIEDCKAAVRWLRANAKTYKIDPDHIGCVGYSAGGHLCCLLGVTDKNDGLEGKGGNADQSSKVQAVVSFFGPTDFTERTWTADIEKGVLVPFIGATFDDKPELYKKASPITYVKKDPPPFLFFHGTADKIVSVTQSRILADKLKSVGGSAKVVEVEGAGHGWGGAELLKTIEQMLAFFDETLKAKK